jgi:hypothetical protein
MQWVDLAHKAIKAEGALPMTKIALGNFQSIALNLFLFVSFPGQLHTGCLLSTAAMRGLPKVFAHIPDTPCFTYAHGCNNRLPDAARAVIPEAASASCLTEPTGKLKVSRTMNHPAHDSVLRCAEFMGH